MMPRCTFLVKAFFQAALLVNFTLCSEVVVSDVEAKEAIEDSSFIGTVITVSSVVCAIVLLIACAGFCPRRSSYKDYDTGPDSYFNDVAIGRPPAVDFAMYPPVESSPAVASMPVYFEPLPDPSKLNQQRQATATKAPASNVKRLRPKISPLSHEDQEGENDCDIVDSHMSQRSMAQQEKLKLERLLANILKANAKQQFPRSQLQYIKELGSGWFGKVLQGEGSGILPGHKKTKVVIQMLKDDSNRADQYAFLMEGLSYREIDSPHVLKLYGQCIDTAPYLCILELCALGDLKSYLRSQRSSVELLDKQGLILNFACDMAAGLQALHQAGFVHRDFAARNCIVTSDMIIKIGDYGLSEELFKDDYYLDVDSNAVPIRWLAPESLFHDGDHVAVKNITKESNLWSFGVALWEVFTCGSLPYGDLSNDHVLRLVIDESCVRLSKPDLPLRNVERLYQLMEMCWHRIPGQRASLRELRIMLLHLRSAVRDNPEASIDFEQKWNQLMPRRVTVDHAEPRATSVDVHNVASDNLDVDLGTLGGSARPISFQSDFSELNTSMSAQAGSLQPSVWSQSVSSPDSAGMMSSDYRREPLAVTSPVNEMSLAAELGAFNSAFGNPEIVGIEDDEAETFTTPVLNADTPQLFNIHAEVHSENAYAVEYKNNEPELDCLQENGVKASAESWNIHSKDFYDINDISVKFSSLNEAQTAVNTQQYASYLQTVTTSVDGDDFQSFGHQYVAGENGVSSTDAATDHPIEFAQFYRSVETDASDVVASEKFLGDDTEFAAYYSEQNVGDRQDTDAGSVA